MCKNIYMKAIFTLLICFIFLFSSITCISYCNYESYIWTIPEVSTETSANVINDSSSNILNLESGSGILIEQNSGKILYEHNSHEQLRPASVTKVMTILLIMEALDSRKN